MNCRNLKLLELPREFGRVVLLVLAAAIPSAVGCGGDGPRTVPVQGKITINGKPVDRGRITFEPIRLVDEKAPSRPAVALIKPDGTFKVTTFSSDDGVQPGDYRVMIWSVVKEPADSDWPKLGKTFFIEWIVPEKYSKASTTPLTATVATDSGSPVEINFDL